MGSALCNPPLPLKCHVLVLGGRHASPEHQNNKSDVCVHWENCLIHNYERYPCTRVVCASLQHNINVSLFVCFAPCGLLYIAHTLLHNICVWVCTAGIICIYVFHVHWFNVLYVWCDIKREYASVLVFCCSRCPAAKRAKATDKVKALAHVPRLQSGPQRQLQCRI